MTSSLAKWRKIPQELRQDGGHQRILWTIDSIKVLNDELCQDCFNFVLVIIVAKFGRKKHLANTLDRDLSQDAVLDHDVVGCQDVKEV